MQSIIVYGVPFSQPVRAVLWLLRYKNAPFTLVPINPGSKGDNGSRSPGYLEKNPTGTIPCIEEPDSGYTLGEAHAIMTYLARTRGWHDVYPDDERSRAQIDAYLHFHHRNIREISIGLVAPNVRKDLNIPEAIQMFALMNFSKALKTLENGYLEHSDYLLGETPSLADFAAYVEIGQLQPQFTNLFDFTDYPLIAAWLRRMSALPGHDDVHVALEVMGDISQEAPDKEVIKQANIKAIVHLQQFAQEN